jgi:23S rRNA (cytidine1920-2'-O)/16S rRNA (cytidine1409-2'-O)-methyltransferase
VKAPGLTTLTEEKKDKEDKKRRKVRLDCLLAEKGYADSRQKAQALIMAGKVFVGKTLVDKPGKEVDPESTITLKEVLPYVGRGGIKLAGPLDELKISVDGLVVMDIGSSTGGFTDCVLKRGAKTVYAVDVGKGLLDFSLRNDPRVRVLEERNIRYLDSAEVGEKVDLVTIDVSFISLELVLPRAKEFLKEGGSILALVKPQFEVGKGQVGKGGIVRDPVKHREVLDRITRFAEGLGFKPMAELESPITGAKGNREFWLYLKV